MRHDSRADLYDLAVLHAEVHRRAAAAGLGVRFKDNLPTAYTDGKNINIPRLKQPVTHGEITRLRGTVIHEVGHINRAQAFKVAKDYNLKGGSPIMELFNQIEDEALERGIAREYVGDAHSLGAAAHLHYKMQIDHILPALQQGAQIDENTAKLWAGYSLCQSTREWDQVSRSSRELFRDIMPKTVRELTETLDKEGWAKKISKANTVDEVWDVTQALHKRLFPNEPEPKKDPNGGGDEDGNGQGKPGEAKSGKDDGEGKGKPTGEKGNEKGSPHKINWKDLKMSDHEEQVKSKTQGGGVDWTGYQSQNIDPQFLPRRFQSRLDKEPPPRSSSLAGRLRILVQSRNRSRTVYDQPSGKLNKRKLGMLGMPIVAGSTAHKRAFKRRVVGRQINTCVHILVDCSGSMSGEKQKVAAQGADRLCVDLARALRVKTAVTGFGGGSGNIPLWKAKEFNEPPVPGIVSGLENAGGGGNADGDAVMYAIETLVPRREQRKIIIVLSDGMPSAAAQGLSADDMLTSAIRCAKGRGIELYGIGIQDASVRRYYGNECKVINSLEEFDSAILSTLADKLLAP